MKVVVNVKAGGLKANREKAGMSQPELAEKSGVNLRTIQGLECGQKDLNHSRLITLLKLCNALDCTLSSLITDEATLVELEKYEERW